MLADKIQAGFPPGVAVPEVLKRLCEFAEEHDHEVSGCFEFERDGRAAALSWLNGDATKANQLAIFGCGPDGSLYGLWLRDGRDASRAPVVFLDSENDGNNVVAGDMLEFLRLLAIGYEEPGRYPTLPPEDPDSAEALREWLAEEFELSAPPKAESLVAAAQAKHPSFDAWLQGEE